MRNIFMEDRQARIEKRKRKRNKKRNPFLIGKTHCKTCNSLAVAQIINDRHTIFICKKCLDIFLAQDIDFAYLIKYI